jgi:glycosyltransferase involved in cell wall biosynthesis
MLVALDATPLVGRQTGVGRYVANLVPELAALDDVSVVLVPFTLRGRRRVPALAGVAVRRRLAPARLLRQAWLRSDFPPVEVLAGPCEVFHGTNFVLPPRSRAAGVLTIHDLAYLRYPETVTPDVLQYRALVPRALASGAIVVTPSQAVAEEVRDAYGLPTDRVLVTPLGVRPEWFTTPAPDAPLRTRYGLPREYALFVGTREPRKNLPTVLAAHTHVAMAADDAIPLVLVGPSGWGEAIQRQPKVHVLDHVPDDDLRSIVAGASTLLMPSSYEGFGLPVLEALSTGKAVVASDLPVLREVGGEQATYVPPFDVDAWAQALLSARTNGAGTPQSRRSRARAFTWARCAEETLRAYRVATA